MKQQFIGLQHCKCGISWKKDIGYFERTGDMVFALERRKVGKKTKPDGNIQTQSGNAMDKPPLENWQKYMENGEYLRSSEIDEEQNYNMIDGRCNNMSPKGKNGRVSVLAKLRHKQAEIARRYGKPAQQMEVAEDMERRRK